MKKTDWTVNECDLRPARMDGTCFYCRSALGQQHKIGCVLRKKTVVVDVVVRMIRTVPEDWDSKQIEFHDNEGTWCSANLVTMIQALNTNDRCMCHQTTVKYVREATTEDEEHFGPVIYA